MHGKLLEMSACHQRGGYVFGWEQGLCVREGTGSVLPLISQPENMESGTLHYIPGPTKVAIPSPLLLVRHLYPDSCKLERLV